LAKGKQSTHAEKNVFLKSMQRRKDGQWRGKKKDRGDDGLAVYQRIGENFKEKNTKEGGK